MASVTVGFTTAVSDSTDRPAGARSWIDPLNVLVDDGNWVTGIGIALFSAGDSVPGNYTTEYLLCTPNYAALAAAIPNVPGVVFDGYELTYERAERLDNRNVRDSSIRLYLQGTGFVGDNKADPSEWVVSVGSTQDQEIVTRGGSSDDWNTSLTRAQVVSALRVGISATGDNIVGAPVAGGVDYAELTVYWHLAHFPSGSTTIRLTSSSGLEETFNPTGSISIRLTSFVILDDTFNPTGSITFNLTGAAVLVDPLSTTGSMEFSLVSVASILGQFRLSTTASIELISTAALGSLRNPVGSITLNLSSSSILDSIEFHPSSSETIRLVSSSELDTTINARSSIELGMNSTGSIGFGNFSFKWSIEHLEASTTHGFPSVYVELDDDTPFTGDFNSIVGDMFDRRLLEMPRLQEIQLDDRTGLAGFQRVTLRIDNSDGLLNSLNLQDSFVRMFFVDETGDDYKEFNGQVVDWTLSHEVTLNVEDLDALAFTQELPKKTLNDLVEAENLSNPVSDDLGKPIPIIFGRAVKVPLLYVRADDNAREYDYIIGEGRSIVSTKFEEVFTVYREDQALDDGIFGEPISFNLVPGGVEVELNANHQRPSEWYRYWWCEVVRRVTGEVLDIVDVASYDGATNKITLNGIPEITPYTFAEVDYHLREWQFYDGQQSNPYEGYAFLRFKKRLGTTGNTDQLYADVNGLQEETNRVGAIASIIGTVRWGLATAVNPSSFSTAASLLNPLTCEGAIINKTSVTDIFQKLLSYRDMVLYKGEQDRIEISVDVVKNTSSHNFGLGDETGYNNILNSSPSINYKHPNEKVKDLKVRYRKNHKENDVYLNELTRTSNDNGVDQTVDLPFVYSHSVADRFLDYKRKRLAAAEKTLSIDVGEEGKKAERGERVTVDIPTLGVSSDWEITSTTVTPAGSNNLNLVPYSATPYTYEASPGLPTDGEGVDENFDIPTDYTNTPPEPVTGQAADPGFEIQQDLTRIGYIDITWTPPDDGNYLEGKVKTKVSGEADSTYIEHPHGYDRVRATPLKVGLTYDLLVSSLNINNLESYAQTITGVFIPGDITDPKIPQGLIGKGKFNKVSWEWNKVTQNTDETPIEDLKGYQYRVWNAISGGTQLYPKDQSIGFTTDTRVEITDSDSDLTTNKRNLYLEVEAIDDSGNTSGYTARVLAATDDVVRDDIEDDTTQVLVEESSNSESPSSISIGVWTTVMDVNITLDRSGTVKIRFQGQWLDTGSGYQIRLRRNTTVLWASNVFTSGALDLATITYADTTSSGNKTYEVQILSNDFGGTGVGLINRSMSAQVDYK